MDQNLLDALRELTDYSDSLDSVTKTLATMYPDMPFIAWREALFLAQNDYRCSGESATDLKLQVALRWLELAKENRLDVKFDPVKGWVVMEKLPKQKVLSKDIEKLLFRLLKTLPEGRLLQYYEIQVAFERATKQSLRDYFDEFNELVNRLDEKRYIVWDDMGGRKLPCFSKGLDFDEWSEMMSKPLSTSAGPIMNFHAPVGAIQTGANSTAHVQQTTGSNEYQQLKLALQAALEEFSKADISYQDREDVRDYLQSILNEIQKEKPNRLSLKSLLSDVATTVQTLGSSSEAYKAVIAALGLLGYS
ncbi:hypothetical protein [Pseudomonas oryzihabitans]|uniref:hypothetical protein n=1 Tax=Pseudomonas oryzihabitans TaxID=47885 RepID=UPI0011A38853|nr:hypothetical protein [Pseudomonas oryzihabitans]